MLTWIAIKNKVNPLMESEKKKEKKRFHGCIYIIIIIKYIKSKQREWHICISSHIYLKYMPNFHFIFNGICYFKPSKIASYLRFSD